MTPDARSQYIKNEKINSLTRLLAAMFTYKLLDKFRTSVTQRKIQETYEVRAKQLATCITGYKYMGGTDKKSTQRKRQASNEGEPLEKRSFVT